MRMKIFAGALLLALAAGCGGASTTAGLDADVVRNGREIAETQCGTCHATGTTGESPRADAPMFRHVLARYKAEPLSEALITGIKVGHPDMPLFEMNPQGVDSLVAYLKSIQTPEPETP